MGLLGRLPTVCFYSRSLLSGHLNVHSVLEGRHVLILVDRVDTDGERAPLPGVDTNTAARLRLQSGFVPITGTWNGDRPPLGTLVGCWLSQNRHHNQPGGLLDHHAGDGSVHQGTLRGCSTWELDLRRTGYATF